MVKPPRDDGNWRPVHGVAPASAGTFRAVGRLAVSDGRDGGSAGFLWLQRGERFEFELRQPVSQRTWRLSGGPGEAVLTGADDGPRQSTSAEALLFEALGWHVPVDALVDWVRGLPHPALDVDGSEHDGQGRLRVLEQGGWQVQYRAWLDETIWPTRIDARQAPYSVRLTIQNWAVDDGGP